MSASHAVKLETISGTDLEEIKLYSDYKSPYAFLAFDPGFALEEKYRVRLRWMPFQLRIKGKGERSVYSEYKVKYSYMDARRWANMRGGIVLRGPLKIYDTSPALIGSLFARKYGKFMEYSRFGLRSVFQASIGSGSARRCGQGHRRSGHERSGIP